MDWNAQRKCFRCSWALYCEQQSVTLSLHTKLYTRIQLTRRIVQTWYTRKENAEGGSHLISSTPLALLLTYTKEKTLKALLNQQRTKVEEIKKKTNYYTTKNLIDRYDSSPSESPLRQRPGVGPKAPQPPGTPQRQGQPLPNGGAPAAIATGASPLGTRRLFDT